MRKLFFVSLALTTLMGAQAALADPPEPPKRPRVQLADENIGVKRPQAQLADGAGILTPTRPRLALEDPNPVRPRAQLADGVQPGPRLPKVLVA